MEETSIRMRDRWRSLAREQQLAVGVLCVVGVTTITLGLLRVRAAVIDPFTTDVQTLVDVKNKLGPTEAELARQAQRSDADGDGLSDYDEQNRYRTSQYLRDSDSDGEADNIEIAKGTDPNCAAGKTCLSIVSGTEASASTTPGFAPPPGPDYGILPGGSPVPPRDPAAIRQALRASGMSEAELASYSDAQLLEAYDQSKNSFDQPAASSTSR
jgi:hypothetical protein